MSRHPWRWLLLFVGLVGSSAIWIDQHRMPTTANVGTITFPEESDPQLLFAARLPAGNYQLEQLNGTIRKTESLLNFEHILNHQGTLDSDDHFARTFRWERGVAPAEQHFIFNLPLSLQVNAKGDLMPVHPRKYRFSAYRKRNRWKWHSPHSETRDGAAFYHALGRSKSEHIQSADLYGIGKERVAFATAEQGFFVFFEVARNDGVTLVSRLHYVPEKTQAE